MLRFVPYRRDYLSCFFVADVSPAVSYHTSHFLSHFGGRKENNVHIQRRIAVNVFDVTGIEEEQKGKDEGHYKGDGGV